MNRKSTALMASGIGLLLAAGGTFFCTRGIHDEGWLSVALTLDHPPGNPSLVGTDVPIKGGGLARVTTVTSHDDLHTSSRRFKVHADIYGTMRTSWSLKHRGWKQVFLVSADSTATALRSVAQVPDTAKSYLADNDMLLEK